MSYMEQSWEKRRERLREQLRHFLSTMRTLQREGHNVDDVLQIICDNLDDLGIDLVLLEELRQMCGKHRRE